VVRRGSAGRSLSAASPKYNTAPWSGVWIDFADIPAAAFGEALLAGLEALLSEFLDIALRLLAAGVLGALIGFERRVHHKAIGIAGMVMIAIGSTTYMLLARHLSDLDSSSISRTLQGFLSGIGFLGGAVVFKSGFDVKGIKAAAAVWIAGAIGLAIATSYWLLGVTVAVATVIVMFVADSFPDRVREEKQEPAEKDSPEKLQ
jgi:putative Mg2+ transporter-C (MgtC) family protein